MINKFNRPEPINKFNRPETLLHMKDHDLYTILYPDYSMLSSRQYSLTIEATDLYYSSGIEGSIVECGIWRGGSTILLAKLFPEKKIFAFDSFCGFEPPGNSPYSYLEPADYNSIGEHDNWCNKERHVPGRPKLLLKKKDIIKTYDWEAPLNMVVSHFKEFALTPEEHGIELIPGFVRNTIPTKLQDIGPIAFLRIDVDAYAATYECLKLCWDNVVENGIIVFDDYAIHEANLAINAFFKEISYTPVYIPKPENGCYIVK